jgi:hypothetical protein
VLYTFDEGAGDVVYDYSGIAPALDLALLEPANTSWGIGSLTFSSPGTRGQSSEAAQKVTVPCRDANAISAEVWVRPEGLTANGPARILTISQGAYATNFSINQNATEWTIRLATNATGANGYHDVDTTGGLVVAGQLTHLLMVFDGAAGSWRLYVDGAAAIDQARNEDLSVWTADWDIAIANEMNEANGTPVNRFWFGELHRAAVWCEALNPEQVGELYAAGP